jgi:hypothetical protein
MVSVGNADAAIGAGEVVSVAQSIGIPCESTPRIADESAWEAADAVSLPTERKTTETDVDANKRLLKATIKKDLQTRGAIIWTNESCADFDQETRPERSFREGTEPNAMVFQPCFS